MKIGIITFWWRADNYGQQLQVYALQRFLRNHGHDAFLIRYDMRTEVPAVPAWKKIYKAFNPLLLFRYICNKLKKNRLAEIESAHPRCFEQFRENTLVMSPIYSSYNDLRDNPPDADVYIAGSDQIWNPACVTNSLKKTPGRVRAYFLDFGKLEVKKMAYAASWGVKSISNEWKNFVSPLLERFSFVGVREKSGIQICCNCGYKKGSNHGDAQWVCDPTLLLSASEYRSLYRNELGGTQDRKPYLLLYYLNNGGKFDIDSVYRFATEKGLEVKYIAGNAQIDKYAQIYPTIYEWLELVDNACYVVTNSFHCCVFSIIFHKQFAAIELNGNSNEMNERLSSLFELCHMEPRLIANCDTTPDFSVLDKEYTASPDVSGGQLLLDELEKY